MNKCLYLNRLPTGGIGNRLFTYNFLYQAASTLNVNANFHKPDSGLISRQRVDPHRLNHLRLRNNFEIPKLYSDQNFSRDFYEALITQRTCIRLPNTLLGEYFFQITQENPAQFFPTLSVDSTSDVDSNFQVAMHFRGGDFRNWNPASILSHDYYLNAFDYLVSEFPSKEISLKIFTDEIAMDSLQRVRKSLAKSVKIEIFCSPNPIDDLRLMAQSKAIISSPSTFAIWAGILSNKSKIIHSKDWVMYRANVGDVFWANIKNGGGEYYEIAKLI